MLGTREATLREQEVEVAERDRDLAERERELIKARAIVTAREEAHRRARPS